MFIVFVLGLIGLAIYLDYQVDLSGIQREVDELLEAERVTRQELEQIFRKQG